VVVVTVVVVFTALSYLGYRWMRDDSLATLVEVSGEPERDTADAKEVWGQASVGDSFHNGDGARTSDVAVAHFRLFNGARLRLKPASKIRFQRGKAQGTIGLAVDVGEADIQSSEGQVLIDSEFGALVLDKNSAITMSRTGGRMAVDVELGRIEIGQDRRAVEAGQSLELELGGIVVDVAMEVAEAPTATPVAPTATPAEPEEAPLDVGDGVGRADVVVAAGESFVVHDPLPPTAVGISVGGVCEGPARLTVGRLKTDGRGQANLKLPAGQHRYEVRCLNKPQVVVATGGIRIVKDSGSRQLPSFSPTANVTTDGRSYTVMYQHRLPTVTVSWPTAPVASSYSLQVNGRTITTKTPSYRFSSLSQGSHRMTFSAATTPPRQSRATTVDVVYDSQAPAARVSELDSGYTPGENVKISGQALPGWEVSVGDRQLEIGAQQKFSAELTGQESIPILFAHPTHGKHYYLRRSMSGAP
jgi:hypothetical protein